MKWQPFLDSCVPCRIFSRLQMNEKLYFVVRVKNTRLLADSGEHYLMSSRDKVVNYHFFLIANIRIVITESIEITMAAS